MNFYQAIQNITDQKTFFPNLQNIARTRLLLVTTSQTFKKGEKIYSPKNHTDYLYFIVEGNVDLKFPKHTVNLKASNYFGIESLLEMPTYISEAIAKSETTVLMVPKKSISHMIGENRDIHYEFSVTLTSYASDQKISKIQPKDTKNDEVPPQLKTLIGWILVLLTPILTYLYFDGLDYKSRVFISIISTMLTSWTFRLLEDFIPAFFALLLCMGFGIADTKFILSGFSSKTFLMALSFFGIGIVVVSSGILLRLFLSLARHLPPKYFWINLALFALGACLTPIIPDSKIRMSVMGNIFYDTLTLLHIKRGHAHKKTITSLSFIFINSVSLLGPIFLTSSMLHFIILGLFWGQYQQDFHWIGWLEAAAVSGLFLLVGFFLVHLIMFRKLDKITFSKDLVKSQVNALGSLSSHEWSSIFTISICFLGMVTTTYHQIAPEIISLLALGSLLVFNFLRPSQFQNKIQWKDLMFLAGIIGLSNTAQAMGLLDDIGNHFQWISEYIDLHFKMFVLILLAIIIIARLFLPSGSTVILLCSILISLTQSNGLNPWIVSFLVLMLNEIWFLPKQSGEYRIFHDITKDTPHDETKLLLTNMLLNIVKVAAIFVSIPYWQKLGLLS